MRYNTQNIPAVILAGGINTIPFFPGHTPGKKVLLRYGGRSCLASVASVLQGIPAVDRMSIVGSDPAAFGKEGLMPAFDFLPGGADVAESIRSGLRHFAASQAVLFVTADLPMITARAVVDFLQRVAVIDCDYNENIFLSLAPDYSFRGDFRQVSKGFVRFKDMAVCHGNLFVLDPAIRHNHKVMAAVQNLYSARKSAARAAFVLGPLVGLAFFCGVLLLHRLSMDQMARWVSRSLGAGLVPVVIEHPEITVDVDEPEDHAFLKKQLG
jgi:molybdopterin-guanine dinucleotide biosynthesis protein A